MSNIITYTTGNHIVGPNRQVERRLSIYAPSKRVGGISGDEICAASGFGAQVAAMASRSVSVPVSSWDQRRVDDIVASATNRDFGNGPQANLKARDTMILPTTLSPWDRVQKALEDQRWDFRTVESIAQDTGLDSSDVRVLLEEHESELRRPMFPDRQGRELFTSRKRRLGWREIAHTIQRCVSKSV